MKTIQDQFTKLTGTVSRQRIYQLRHQAAGLCMLCCRPAESGTKFCQEHAIKLSKSQAEKYRKNHARKRRSSGRWIRAIKGLKP